ncbi:hypothetical protein COBT_002957 [Conglomerata obtusa]
MYQVKHYHFLILYFIKNALLTCNCNESNSKTEKSFPNRPSEAIQNQIDAYLKEKQVDPKCLRSTVDVIKINGFVVMKNGISSDNPLVYISTFVDVFFSRIIRFFVNACPIKNLEKLRKFTKDFVEEYNIFIKKFSYHQRNLLCVKHIGVFQSYLNDYLENINKESDSVVIFYIGHKLHVQIDDQYLKFKESEYHSFVYNKGIKSNPKKPYVDINPNKDVLVYDKVFDAINEC